MRQCFVEIKRILHVTHAKYCIGCLKYVRITNLCKPFTLTRCATFSGFVLLQFRLEFCNTNDCNIRYMITESS